MSHAEEHAGSWVLRIDCADAKGLVHTITGVLLEHDLNIVGQHEFVDAELRHFYMRTTFPGPVDATSLADALRHTLPVGAAVTLAALRPKRVVVLATREPHCLGDLLLRHASGELPVDLAAVISNHDRLARLTERFEIPFVVIPHEGVDRDAHDAAVGDAVASYDPELVVLAKYMRILTPAFIRRFAERIINIHHSFLPAFIGARPYQQAFARGVKIIGATSHFVTEELDQGPIIAQSIIPVDHTHSAHDMAMAGRDVERVVLARALKLVCEDRVFVAGNRTVIFD